MATSKPTSRMLDRRNSERRPTERFVTIKELNKPDGLDIDAIVTDSSGVGISVLTYSPIAIGTEIEIDLHGEYAAKGEVINLDMNPAEPRNKVRLGVQVTEKNANWPL